MHARSILVTLDELFLRATVNNTLGLTTLQFAHMCINVSFMISSQLSFFLLGFLYEEYLKN